MKIKDYSKSLSDLSEDYSYVPTREDLGGRSSKKFARIDRSVFEDMVDSISSGNSSYVTYLNDAIRDGYMLQHVSAMQKELSRWDFYLDDNVYYDVAGSRVANMLGIPTCYNTIYREKVDGKIYPKYLLSVDMLKGDERMYDINTLAGHRVDCNSCLGWNGWIDEVIEEHVKNNRSSVFDGVDVEKFLPQIHEDMVEQFFFRRALLADNDYYGRNVALVVSKEKGTISLSPNYDYDMCMKSVDGIFSVPYVLESNMNNAVSAYPQAIRRFVSRLDKFDSSKLFSQLVSDIGDREFARTYVNTIEHNINLIKNYYAKCIGNKVSDTPEM